MSKKKLKTLPPDYLKKALESSVESTSRPRQGSLPTSYVSSLSGSAKVASAEQNGVRAKVPKARLSFTLPEGLCERFRNTVRHLAKTHGRLGLSVVAEQALERELDRLEKKLNDGKPFPAENEKRRRKPRKK